MGECGTRSGYIQHIIKKEPTCDGCRAANTQYQRDRKAGKRLRQPKATVERVRPQSPVNIEGHREANYYPEDPAMTLSSWALDRNYDPVTRSYQ